MATSRTSAERRARLRVYHHARNLAREALTERHNAEFYAALSGVIRDMLYSAGFTAGDLAELWRQAERKEYQNGAQKRRF